MVIPKEDAREARYEGDVVRFILDFLDCEGRR